MQVENYKISPLPPTPRILTALMPWSFLYSVSVSSGTDVSMQMQFLSVCTHYLFLRESVCKISLGACDLALRLANKRTTSLPEDSDTEYRW